MSFFKKLNNFVNSVEKKGFKAANTAHRWAVNGILLFIAYEVYSLLRDYNDGFMEARVSE
jgi:hypothetical protein